MVRLQFEAQRRGYAADFPEADDLVLLWEGTPAGRLLLCERQDEVRLVDLAVGRKYRNRGLGSYAIGLAVSRAEGQMQKVRLSVRRDNVHAIRLYATLGFVTLTESPLYLEMERLSS